MAIQSFDKNTAEEIHQEIFKDLEVIAKKHGLKISRSNGSYTDVIFKYTTEFQLASATEVIKKEEQNKAKREFRIYASLWGLKVDWLGQIYSKEGQEYQIEGWSNRQKKYKVQVIRTKDGKKFKTSPQSICLYMGTPESYKYHFSNRED